MNKAQAAAHKWTDEEIAKMEKELTAIYSQSYKDIKRKSNRILDKINYSTTMTPAQRIVEVNKYKRLKSLENQVSEILKDTNAEAVKIINSKMGGVYLENYKASTSMFPQYANFPRIGKSAVKMVLHEQITPFKQLSIDTLLSRADIQRELTQSLTNGIMQGESIPNIAKRIKDITNKNLSQSVRIARTETTRVENSAKQDVGEQGTKLGFKMKKRWVSTTDSRTRPAHGRANGQIVDIDKPFIVGGEKLMYPGDEAGSAWNVVNCRCTTVNVIDKGRE